MGTGRGVRPDKDREGLTMPTIYYTLDADGAYI